MLSVHFCLDDGKNDKNETVENYKELFIEFIKKPPSLDEALNQLLETKGIDENKINNYKKEIINDCKNLYEKNSLEVKKKYPKLSEEEFNIICSYTCQTKEEDFSPFKILNQNLISENRKSGIEKVTKYFYLLLTTLRKLKKEKYKNLYRAIKNVLQLKEGETKTFWGFTSTSFKNEVSKSFLGNNEKIGTFYLIKNAWGYDISLFNYFKEKEILLEPERKYEVEGIINYQGSQVYTIICNYIESPTILNNIIKTDEENYIEKISNDNNRKDRGTPIKKEDDKKGSIKNIYNFIFFGILESLILLSAVFYLLYKLYWHFFDTKTIIGIDFGHSFSGFAVLESNDNKRVYFSESESKSGIIPTKIIIDKTEYSAITIPNNKLKIDNLAAENKLLFFNFKKNLDPRNYKNKIESNLPLNSIVPLENVIKAYFEKLKKNYIDENKKIQETNLNKIKWIITIPPLYDERSKKLMKKIACKTLLNQNSCEDKNEQLQLALEPEVASLALIYDKKVGHLFYPGKTFLLVDAGGFTVDFSLNQIIRKNNLKQLSISKSLVFGSNLINEKIIEVIELIFKKDKIDYIRNNYYTQWAIVLDEIENIKLTIDQIESDNIKFSVKLNIDAETCWSCWFKGLWKDCLCEIEYDSNTFSFNKNNIFIPKKYIRNIIYNLASDITKEIKNYYNENKIDLIAITGGFSYNNILRELIRDELNNLLKRDKLIFLDSPQETVMKGAAIYGLNPNQIKERILPITIGVKSYEKCNYEECSKYKINFKRGDTVLNDHVYQIKRVYPKFDTTGIIEVYYSLNDKFNNDEKLLVKIPLDYDSKKKKRKIYIKFNSYISISAYDPKENEWNIVDYP